MEKIPTKELRWVEREVPYQGSTKISTTIKVLQQRWYFEYGDSYKWEDVPTVKEEE